MAKPVGTKKRSGVPRAERPLDHRLRRLRVHSMTEQAESRDQLPARQDSVVLDCGWGRLLFAPTFGSDAELVDALRKERSGQRDIVFYVRDPHVVLTQAPQETFLDPSHTYRLDLATYRAGRRQPKGYFIRRLSSEADAVAVNAIYAARGMVAVLPEFFWSNRDSRSLTYFVAEEEATGDIVGTVTGVDHSRLFQDPERGSSLWCLAVDPQSRYPGIGEMLARRLAEYFQARGANYLDLSVLHDNEPAIGLYEGLGFRRIPLFAVKRKNPINEKLFSGQIEHYEDLNPYARIIIDEAARRGVHAEVTDAAGGFFRLSYGGRSIHCRESLSEMTSGVAVSICDDKAVTRRIVAYAGVAVPEQITAGDSAAIEKLVADHGSVVVKPARGEQGRGVSVGLANSGDIERAIAEAGELCDRVLVESCFEGQDLRLVVIDYKLVAAAIRKPPSVFGDGQRSLATLIERQSRRRSAATDGESRIPVDEETLRCLASGGRTLETVPAEGEEVLVRKTANLHTGGSIHDVTGIVHPKLVEAAKLAAQAIDIPVVGIDFMVKSPTQPDYVFIEANERPGLANHEPQPTAERFIDLLFPQSRIRLAKPASGAAA